MTYLLFGPLFLQGLESLDIDKILIFYFILLRVHAIKYTSFTMIGKLIHSGNVPTSIICLTGNY